MITFLATIIVICSYKPDYICEEINKRPAEEMPIEVKGIGYSEPEKEKDDDIEIDESDYTF